MSVFLPRKRSINALRVAGSRCEGWLDLVRRRDHAVLPRQILRHRADGIRRFGRRAGIAQHDIDDASGDAFHARGIVQRHEREPRAEALLQRHRQFHRHQRVHAEILQRALRVDPVGTDAQDARDVLGHEAAHDAHDLLDRLAFDQRGKIDAVVVHACMRQVGVEPGEARARGRGQQARHHGPVEVRDEARAIIRFEQGRKTIQRGRRAERRAAHAAGCAVLHCLVAGEIAGIADCTPADTRDRQAERAPQLRQAFEAGIRRDVAALAGTAQQGRHRRIQHEVFDRMVETQRVQVPRAEQLRAHHMFDARDVEIGEQPIVDRHRRMQDAGQGRQRVPEALEQCAQCNRIGDVAGFREHVHARNTQRVDGLVGARRVHAAPSDQHEVSDTTRRQPARGFQAESAQPAAHEPGAVARETQRRFRFRAGFDAGR